MSMPSQAMLSVVVHDVAPATWPACLRVIHAVRQIADIPLTLLVVPRYHHLPGDRLFERSLDHLLDRGHELTLHGYSHLDEGQPRGWKDHILRRWYTNGEGEFCDLPEAEALVKLHAGMQWFAHHQWPLQGFVAPAWLLSDGTWQAFRQLPLRYTSTLNAVYHLPEAACIPSACMVFSTRRAWRRLASIPRNAYVSQLWDKQPLVRLELHPHDADYPLIRRYWSGKLQELLAQRVPLTLSDAISRLHPS